MPMKEESGIWLSTSEAYPQDMERALEFEGYVYDPKAPLSPGTELHGFGLFRFGDPSVFGAPYVLNAVEVSNRKPGWSFQGDATSGYFEIPRLSLEYLTTSGKAVTVNRPLSGEYRADPEGFRVSWKGGGSEEGPGTSYALWDQRAVSFLFGFNRKVERNSANEFYAKHLHDTGRGLAPSFDVKTWLDTGELRSKEELAAYASAFAGLVAGKKIKESLAARAQRESFAYSPVISAGIGLYRRFFEK